ncbi:MAG: phosphoglucosamine mutase [Planctomycetes bacterium]|nr:phosphoglucosamine mutase [Planctomycetota bacterium]
MSRLFGTDGIRGLAGEEPLTPETVSRIAGAFAECLQSDNATETGGRPWVLIGHDGRESADCLVASVQAGLAAAGVDSQEAGLITTPGLATLVRELGAAGGAMLSASHNPARDNGIKLFNNRGEKLDDATERRIEASVAHPRAHAPGRFGARRAGSAVRPEIYLGGLVERSGIARDALYGYRIAFDGAHGGGAFLGPDLFRSLGAQVFEIGTSPDGLNINDGFGALHPEKLAKLVIDNKCHLGLALDGDGDRSMFVDERGDVVDGDGVIAACAPDLLERGELPGAAVVSTVMSNFGLQQFLRDRNIQIEQVPVGDRNVVARLKERGLALGAEPSGHVVFGDDNAFVGDGLYTALRVLDLLYRRKVTLSSLAHFERAEQVMINVTVTKRTPLEELPAVMDAKSKAERDLAGRGRVVLRYSGTEPLVRVMVESTVHGMARRHASEIADAVRQSILN